MSKEILIVDDDDFEVQLLSEHLLSRGFSNLTVVRSQGDALQVLMERRFSLLFTDCQMHGDDDAGLTLIRHVRCELELTRLPIVMVSSRDEAVVMTRLMEYQAGFLKKPIEGPQLERWLRYIYG